MKQIKNSNHQEEFIEELDRPQLEKAISYLDTRIQEEQDITRMMEYCVMKVDLLNELMFLDNNNHLRI